MLAMQATGTFTLTWATERTEEPMKTQLRPSPMSMRALEAAFSLAFLGAVTHHVAAHDFRPLAALLGPVLILYYGLASLLFVRGKSLADGPWQRRSMHAGERAMQATVWHVLGIVMGVGAYGLLRALEGQLGAPAPTLALVLLFAGPYALLQAGLLSFLRAVWAIAPHLTRRVSTFEVRRRVQAARKVALGGRAGP